MKITFTVNITRAIDDDFEERDATKEDYDTFAQHFGYDNHDVEHELIRSDGTILYFEMEDITSDG